MVRVCVCVCVRMCMPACLCAHACMRDMDAPIVCLPNLFNFYFMTSECGLVLIPSQMNHSEFDLFILGTLPLAPVA